MTEDSDLVGWTSHLLGDRPTAPILVIDYGRFPESPIELTDDPRRY